MASRIDPALSRRPTTQDDSWGRRTGSVAAAQAKAHLLSLMDQVSRDGVPVVITKRGKPLVQIAPLDPAPPVPDIFGCMKGTVTIFGDIVGPEPDEWEAMQ